MLSNLFVRLPMPARAEAILFSTVRSFDIKKAESTSTPASSNPRELCRVSAKTRNFRPKIGSERAAPLATPCGRDPRWNSVSHETGLKVELACSLRGQRKKKWIHCRKNVIKMAKGGKSNLSKGGNWKHSLRKKVCCCFSFHLFFPLASLKCSTWRWESIGR